MPAPTIVQPIKTRVVNNISSAPITFDSSVQSGSTLIWVWAANKSNTRTTYIPTDDVNGTWDGIIRNSSSSNVNAVIAWKENSLSGLITVTGTWSANVEAGYAGIYEISAATAELGDTRRSGTNTTSHVASLDGIQVNADSMAVLCFTLTASSTTQNAPGYTRDYDGGITAQFWHKMTEELIASEQGAYTTSTARATYATIQAFKSTAQAAPKSNPLLFGQDF